MIDLERYFKNPFDDEKISLGCLLSFTTDHVQRLMAANDGGQFTARLAATNAALSAVDASYADDTAKLGVRKARKMAKRMFRRALPERLGRIYGRVVMEFGSRSAELKECFGGGRSKFFKVSDDLMREELETLIAGVMAYQAKLGAETVAAAQALLDSWMAVYEPSEAASSAKSASELAKREAQAALRLELFLNLLALAARFPRQPQQLRVYMQKSLLRSRRRKAAGELVGA